MIEEIVYFICRLTKLGMIPWELQSYSYSGKFKSFQFFVVWYGPETVMISKDKNYFLNITGSKQYREIKEEIEFYLNNKEIETLENKEIINELLGAMRNEIERVD